MAAMNSAQQGGKYTQGFVFEHGQINGDYARAVVERSCVAVVTLLQDVFALAEKNTFQQAAALDSVQEQNRVFRRLVDMVRYRPLLEKSLVTAVSCAYAEIANAAMNAANTVEIEKRITELEQLCCERLDLIVLFDAHFIRDNTTNRTRPLLLDLNAQISLLFAKESKNIICNPLSPATLIDGFVAGLMCAEMDILAKQLLFRAFEQEFLSKLSVLLNSVVLRLEQENTFVKHVVGLDDKNAGPIERVLQNPSLLPLSELQQTIDKMHQVLSSHRGYSVAQGLYELSGENALDSVINLCSDVNYYYEAIRPAALRSATRFAETAVLIETRQAIAEHLNATLTGKQMPVAVKVFFETLWTNALFEILVTAGKSSAIWQDAVQLQQALLESVTPVNDAGELTALNLVIPRVIKTLRKLLDETGCRFEEMAAFLGELKLLHLQNMQQQLNQNAFVVWESLSMGYVSAAAEPLLDESEMVCYGQMKEIISLLSCPSR